MPTSQASEVLIGPYGTRVHRLDVGKFDHWIAVRGIGNSDLDCWLYNSGGELTDSDAAPSDSCELETAGDGRYRLEVENLGRRSNRYVIRKHQVRPDRS